MSDTKQFDKDKNLLCGQIKGKGKEESEETDSYPNLRDETEDMCKLRQKSIKF